MYRVHLAREGEGIIYCGDYPDYEQAVAVAESEPDGLPEFCWDNARNAGHQAGMEAPPPGREDDDPISWHGKDGYYCVVVVHNEEQQ